jgi:hypothetical protein
LVDRGRSYVFRGHCLSVKKRGKEGLGCLLLGKGEAAALADLCEWKVKNLLRQYEWREYVTNEFNERWGKCPFDFQCKRAVIP